MRTGIYDSGCVDFKRLEHCSAEAWLGSVYRSIMFRKDRDPLCVQEEVARTVEDGKPARGQQEDPRLSITYWSMSA